MRTIRLKCSQCGGPKFIGEQYYLNGTYFVDVTCVICADTKDIEVAKLKTFLSQLQKQRGGNDKK